MRRNLNEIKNYHKLALGKNKLESTNIYRDATTARALLKPATSTVLILKYLGERIYLISKVNSKATKQSERQPSIVFREKSKLTGYLIGDVIFVGEDSKGNFKELDFKVVKGLNRKLKKRTAIKYTLDNDNNSYQTEATFMEIYGMKWLRY